MMIQAKVSRRVNAPVEKIWSIMTDITTPRLYNPRIKNLKLLSKNCEGIGATRVVHLHDGSSVRETVVAIDDRYIEHPNLTLELSDYSGYPLQWARTTTSVDAIDENTSLVTFCMDYEAKYGWIGHIFGTTLVKAGLTSLLEEVTQGLAYHVTTGKAVGKAVPSF